MHGVRREAASRVALATAPPANPRPSAGLNESLALKSSTVSKATYVSIASVCGNGLNGICQRQGHTGVEREKEERRADRRTDRDRERKNMRASTLVFLLMRTPLIELGLHLYDHLTLITFLEVPSPNTVTVGLRALTYEFGEDIFSP